MTSPTPAARVEPNDPEYLRRIQEEADFWGRPGLLSVDTELPATDAYWNERFTGDPRTAWYDTIASYGRFQRGCSLGTGGLKQNGSLLEGNPGLHLTIYDISEESLAVFQRDLGARFPGRVTTERLDLNFAELPERGYDLIASEGCLHHIENLEHIAFQINRALTPEGYFFLRDYVGEARFRFSEEKKRAFESAFAGAQARRPVLHALRVAWPDAEAWPYSPFEAVRSDETLDILRRYLTEVSVRAAGPLVGLFLCVCPAEAAAAATGLPARAVALLRRIARRPQPGHLELLGLLAAELLPLDRTLGDAANLRPMNAFAVYRKQQETAP